MNATRIDRGSTDTTTIYSDGAELVFERTFDAPRERVWKALTDPELVPRWWGKHGTTTTVVEMDVRPGGTWRYINSAPDRDDVVFYGEYLEVTPPTGYKWTFMFDVEGVGPMGGPETHILEEVDGKTKTSVGARPFDSSARIIGACMSRSPEAAGSSGEPSSPTCSSTTSMS